jgi:uncharacterized membrane protein
MSAEVETPHPRKQLFRALEAKSLRSRDWPTRTADTLTAWSSTPFFLFLNMVLFAIWIALNTGWVPGLKPFDPFPYGLLTMAVSLEAIMLSIFVLISQNRAAQIATLREELHLRINLIAEQEITKTLKILAHMRKKMGIRSEDTELEKMIEDIDTSDLEQSINDQLERAGKSNSVFRSLTKREFGTVLSSVLGLPKKEEKK